MVDPRKPAPKPAPPIKDVGEFAQRLHELYGRAFAGLGRDTTYQVFFKFWIRRLLRHLESKFGGPADGDAEDRDETLDHFEEELQDKINELAETYFDSDEGDDAIA